MRVTHDRRGLPMAPPFSHWHRLMRAAHAEVTSPRTNYVCGGPFENLKPTGWPCTAEFTQDLWCRGFTSLVGQSTVYGNTNLCDHTCAPQAWNSPSELPMLRTSMAWVRSHTSRPVHAHTMTLVRRLHNTPAAQRTEQPHVQEWSCCMADASPEPSPDPSPPSQEHSHAAAKSPSLHRNLEPLSQPRCPDLDPLATHSHAHTAVGLCLYDTGSNCTAMNDPTAFTDYRAYPEPRRLGLASNATAAAIGEGSCRIELLTTQGTWVEVVLHAVLVPDFRRPIISACKLRATTGWKFTPNGDFAARTQVPPLSSFTTAMTNAG